MKTFQLGLNKTFWVRWEQLFPWLGLAAEMKKLKLVKQKWISKPGKVLGVFLYLMNWEGQMSSCYKDT